MVLYGMVNVNLYSTIVTKLVAREKPGFQALSKGLIVLLYAKVVRRGVPDLGDCTVNARRPTVDSQCRGTAIICCVADLRRCPPTSVTGMQQSTRYCGALPCRHLCIMTPSLDRSNRHAIHRPSNMFIPATMRHISIVVQSLQWLLPLHAHLRLQIAGIRMMIFQLEHIKTNTHLISQQLFKLIIIIITAFV